ncbi:MAG TPA: NPCBM/NEW2 domain-containing protein, partial [Planctomycetaceae bacterium]|nr:NPCBM/NEW2 domain-containing protein [Planctomycetaceae bacterium]
VKRDKVFGLVFARRQGLSKAAPVRVELANGDVLMAASLTDSAEGLKAKLISNVEVPLPLEQVKVIDLSRGKLRYLSQMEPREVKYTPYFDITWEYRRDTNMDGGPLRLGSKIYSRGLCVHSKTLLKYRLGGDYRRLQAVVGIDHLVASNGFGDCRLVISGDGKPLLEADVKAKDSPRPIDLDVSGVVTLEVLVDFGGNLDISDHLDLADAKLVK